MFLRGTHNVYPSILLFIQCPSYPSNMQKSVPPSIHPSIHLLLSIFPSIHLFIFPTFYLMCVVSLFILSIHLYLPPTLSFPVYLPIYLFYLSICIYLSICRSAQSICLSIRQSTHLDVKQITQI